MNETANIWKEDGTFLTYIGGSRSRRNGIFAGLADIQGMDMYVSTPHRLIFRPCSPGHHSTTSLSIFVHV